MKKVRRSTGDTQIKRSMTGYGARYRHELHVAGIVTMMDGVRDDTVIFVVFFVDVGTLIAATIHLSTLHP